MTKFKCYVHLVIVSPFVALFFLSLLLAACSYAVCWGLGWLFREQP